MQSLLIIPSHGSKGNDETRCLVEMFFPLQYSGITENPMEYQITTYMSIDFFYWNLSKNEHIFCHTIEIVIF